MPLAAACLVLGIGLYLTDAGGGTGNVLTRRGGPLC